MLVLFFRVVVLVFRTVVIRVSQDGSDGDGYTGGNKCIAELAQGGKCCSGGNRNKHGNHMKTC